MDDLFPVVQFQVPAEPDNGLVPFGKYKGQPVQALLADQSYLQWLLAQAWFMQRYEQLYKFVTHQGITSDETPEHNALQLRFLDNALCLQAAWAWAAFLDKHVRVVCDVRRTQFERSNIDVLFWHTTLYWEPAHVQSGAHFRDGQPREIPGAWHQDYPEMLGIELKPTIGDDYPAMLRKMGAKITFEGGMEFFVTMLVYERWQSQMPVAQVKRLFARSFKLLISLEELAAYPAEPQPVPTEPPADSRE